MMDVRSGGLSCRHCHLLPTFAKCASCQLNFRFLLRMRRNSTLMFGRTETFRLAPVTLLCRRGAPDSVNELWTDLLTVTKRALTVH